MERIEELTAFLALDEDGNEGLMHAHTGRGTMALIAADADAVEQYRPLAEHIAGEGKTIRLVRFSVREDLEVFGDSGNAA